MTGHCYTAAAVRNAIRPFHARGQISADKIEAKTAYTNRYDEIYRSDTATVVAKQCHRADSGISA